MKHIDNVKRIRRTLGTGPVRKPEPVVKARRAVGEREQAMRVWREEQANPLRNCNRS